MSDNKIKDKLNPKRAKLIRRQKYIEIHKDKPNQRHNKLKNKPKNTPNNKKKNKQNNKRSNQQQNNKKRKLETGQPLKVHCCSFPQPKLTSISCLSLNESLKILAVGRDSGGIELWSIQKPNKLLRVIQTFICT